MEFGLVPKDQRGGGGNQEEGKEESSKLAEKQPQHAHKSLTLSLLFCYLSLCL